MSEEIKAPHTRRDFILAATATAGRPRPALRRPGSALRLRRSGGPTSR